MRVIGYVRVSRGEVQIHSPKAQREEIEAWTAKRGGELVQVFVDRLSGDPGEFETTLESNVAVSRLNLQPRPGLCDAVKRCREGDIDVLVAAKRDRMFRGGAEAMAILQRLVEPARLESTDIDLQALGLSAPFVASLQDTVARHELMLIRDRTRATRKSNRRAGLRLGAVPYGWRDPQEHLPPAKRDRCRRLECSAKEQRIIEQILELREGGRGFRSIASELDNRGVKTRSGTQWHPQTIARIIERATQTAEGT